jgi:hypothetical protein
MEAANRESRSFAVDMVALHIQGGPKGCGRASVQPLWHAHPEQDYTVDTGGP